MKIKKGNLFWIGIVVLSLYLQSCATIMGGRNNTLVFNQANTSNAQVFIDDTLVGKAEGKLILPKKVIQHGSMLEIRAEGYETQEYLILRKPHTLYVLANFFIGGIPLVVDYGTGNIFRPVPRKFENELERKN